MYDHTINRHLILTQERKKRKYNLWLMKSIFKAFIVIAGMTGIAMATSLIAGLIT